MKQISTDEFLPLIEPFKRFVKTSFLAKSVVFLLICCMLFTAIIGMIFTADTITAISIASIMLLSFLFYLIRLYMKESVFHRALETKNTILEKAKRDSLDESERAELFSRLALSTHFLPVNLIKLPPYLSFIEVTLNKFLSFFTWRLLHLLGEVFFLAAGDEHISLIKKDPTNLSYHASLANCYVMLSHHYREPIKAKPLLSFPGIFISTAMQKTLLDKADDGAKNALEELSILQTFAPDELWVHDQLAISYKELKMPEKEIEEYEAILRLCPDDQQASLRLGILYFAEGKNAKGLEIYEQLKNIQPILAEELIEHYGAYHPLLS
jgi:tetratricopeptide (TPR) repeat protein